MHALILAAGYATRLYPLTLDKPKPLLEVAGKPIVGHIADRLQNIPIEKIFVVTNNRFYTDFEKWLQTYSSSKPITIINDGTNSNEDRLGAIGDIDFVLRTKNIHEDLLIIGGDNLFEDDLVDFLRFFERNGSSILLQDVKNIDVAKKFGVVTLDQTGKIIQFIEKPEHPSSTLASTLVYALKKEHLELLSRVKEQGKWDRPGDFIAYLSPRRTVYGNILRGRWFDIGSLDQLEEANKAFQLKEVNKVWA
ncbi:nucleotidyltransferase family protein [Candidatus Woesearchaeota archaeon]|nr:nucleotidyltransferase family protein [Candidatus Woesearchaeota archaeon]